VKDNASSLSDNRYSLAKTALFYKKHHQYFLLRCEDNAKQARFERQGLTEKGKVLEWLWCLPAELSISRLKYLTRVVMLEFAPVFIFLVTLL